MSSAAARKKGTAGSGNADGNDASGKADTMGGCKSRTSDTTALCKGDAAADEPGVGFANFKIKRDARRHDLFATAAKGKRRKKNAVANSPCPHSVARNHHGKADDVKGGSKKADGTEGGGKAEDVKCGSKKGGDTEGNGDVSSELLLCDLQN